MKKVLGCFCVAVAIINGGRTFGSPQGGSPTAGMGIYRGNEQKALSWYARGMGSKRKAEQEKDLQTKVKFYQKAKEELERSLGYQGHYDGYLALGEVDLALGEKSSAEAACKQALALKPSDPAATACIEAAGKAKPGETAPPKSRWMSLRGRPSGRRLSAC
ncbi:MAG TPA: hypothetical protein VF173_32170 [Thermoanaerobaculia bacterium]|nr:hypothetical protein [Thermoanaerobaculia bacterium]